MVAIVSGNSLGLSLTSLATLGQRGTFGTSSGGNSGEQAFVNVFNGNLVVQDTDEELKARGLDVTALRTYNSQGLTDDDNSDNWTSGFFDKNIIVSGTLGNASSTVTRVAQDGARAVYTWHAASSAYRTTEGSGAHDTITYDSTYLHWKDGSTGAHERYRRNDSRLAFAADGRGNELTYEYNNNRISKISTNAGESLVFDYNNGAITRITLTSGGVDKARRTLYEYNNNRLSAVTVDLSPADRQTSDNNVYKTTYTYNNGRLATVTQPDGNKLTFTYVQIDNVWKVATVTDALAQTTTFSYGTNSTTVTDALGATTVYEYETAAGIAGRLTKVIAPAVNGSSQVTEFKYNANGDLTKVIHPGGRTVEMGYDEWGNQTLQIDSAGNTITRTYDARNQLLTETTWLVPDADGTGTASQPAQPQTSRFIYDDQGKNLLRFVLTPEGRVTEHRYDDTNGNHIATLQYMGTQWDVSNLAVNASPTLAQLVAMTATQTEGVRTTTFHHDMRGQVDWQTDDNGVVTDFTRDYSGQLEKAIVRSAAGDQVTQYTYDGLGRLGTTTDALNQLTTHVYDAALNTVKITSANGLIVTKTYDKAGRLTSVSEGNVTTALSTTRYSYDALGRLVQTQDPTGVRSWLLYDAAGRKVADVDGNGSLVEYIYNAENQVTRTIAYSVAVNTSLLVDALGNPLRPALSAIRPSTGSTRSSWNVYDSSARLAMTVDADGHVAKMTYDGASRLLQTRRYADDADTSLLGNTPAAADVVVTASDASDRIERNLYDADGLLVGVLDGEGGLTEMRYNGTGELVTRIRYAALAPQQHRAAGGLAQLRVPSTATPTEDQVTWFLRNELGAVEAEIDAEGYVTEFIYDPAGQLKERRRYAQALSQPKLGDVDSTTRVQDLNLSAAGAHSSHYTYDKLGRLTQEVDFQGTLTLYAYDTAGNLLKKAVRAPSASDDLRAATKRYDLQGRVTAELSAEGAAKLVAGLTTAQIDQIWAQHAVAHSYDAAGRRTSSTDQNGFKTLFFYDVDGQLTHTINALGEVSENKYDTFGQLEQQSRYSKRLSASTLSGLAGGLVTSALTSALTALNDTQASKTSYTYTAAGRLKKVTDPLQFARNYVYNTFGQQERVTQDLGGGQSVATTSAYDRRGLLRQTVADAGGIDALTQYDYDAFGRVTEVTDPVGGVRHTTYDRLGRVVSTSDARNNDSSTGYDAFSRVVSRTDALLQQTTYSYNDSERSVTITSPEGVTVKTTYDRLGQEQSVVDGAGNETRYSYDKDGNLKTVSRVIENNVVRVVEEHAYDRANRLLESLDANGKKVAYSYDAANRTLTRTVDAVAGGLNLVTEYTWDAKGLQLTEVDPNRVTTSFTYDLKGQLKKRTVDPTGLNLVTEYDYDGASNVLKVTTPGKTITAYAYDKLGRRETETIDPYDAATNADGLNLITRWTYDDAGNVLSRTDASGRKTWYAYDADGRLAYSVNQLGEVEKRGYDAVGRLTQTVRYVQRVTLPAGMQSFSIADAELAVRTDAADAVENRYYDKDGRLNGVATALGGGKFGVVGFVHDGAGNVIERRSFAKPVDAANPVVVADPLDEVLRTVYDKQNRAIFSIDGAGAVVASSYDNNGNLVDRIAYAGKVSPATAATREALSAAVATVANTARDARVRHAYDAANRLVWSVDGAGAVTRRVYDANGNVTMLVQYANPIAATAAPDTVVANGPADRVTRHAFDAANRCVYTVDGLYGVTSHGYDADGRVLQRTLHAKAVTGGTQMTLAGIKAALDAQAAADTAANRVTKFAYDGAGRLSVETDAMGAAVEHAYDGAGRLLKTTAYANGLADKTNAANRVTHHAYDAAGRQVFTVDPLLHVAETRYDALGRVTDQLLYDAPIAAGTLMTEQGIAAAIDTTPGLDRHEHLTYDNAGRLATKANALGHTERYAYDGIGRKTSFTNPKNATWDYEYDAAGRLVKEIAPEVTRSILGLAGAEVVHVDTQVRIQSVMAYDALGNLLSRTEAAGLEEARTTRYEYDALGRQVRTIHPTVGVYDAAADNLATNGASGLAERRDAGRDLESSTTYDALGNATVGRDLAGNTSYKFYDRLGNVAYEVDAMGYVVGYKRNAFGEVTELKRYASAFTGVSTATTLTMDSKAAQASALSRAITTTYDRMGRVLTVTEPATTVMDGQTMNSSKAKVSTHTYNAFGNRITTNDGRATTSWFYDARGMEKASVDALGFLTTQTYDAAGNLEERKEYAKALSSGNWNAATGVYGMPGSSPDTRTTRYTYDAAGRRVAETRVAVQASSNTAITHRSESAVTVPAEPVQPTFNRTAGSPSVPEVEGFAFAGRTDGSALVEWTKPPAYYIGVRMRLVGSSEWQDAVFTEEGGKQRAYLSAGTPPGTYEFEVRHYMLSNEGGGESGNGYTTEYVVARTSGTLVFTAPVKGAVTMAALPVAEPGVQAIPGLQARKVNGLWRIEWNSPASGETVFHYQTQGSNNWIREAFRTEGGRQFIELPDTIALGTYKIQVDFRQPVAATTQDAVTRYTYDAVGNLTSTTDPANGVSYVFYDALGRVNATVAPAGNAGAALVEFFRDAHGNAVYQTQYANAATAVSLAGYAKSADEARDRDGASLFDRLGRTLQTMDGEKVMRYFSYDAMGHVAKSWQAVENGSGGWATLYEVNEHDALGRLVRVTAPAPADSNGASSGSASTRMTYNAFGEMTHRTADGISGLPGHDDGEYWHYNDAGLVWKTNAGDGIDRVYLYDTQGRATLEVRNTGIEGDLDVRTLGSQAQLLNATGGRRTVTTYDALGRATAQVLPTKQEAQGGVTVGAVTTSAQVLANPQVASSQGQWTWSGPTRISLAWTSLAALGPGDVKVELRYDTRTVEVPESSWTQYGDTDHTYTYPGFTIPSEAKSLTRTFLAEEARNGVTMEWTDAANDGGGIGQVTGLTVWKKDLYGEWVALVDQRSGLGNGPTNIFFTAPPNPESQVEFHARRVGTTQWTVYAPHRFGDQMRLDVTGLVGTYEYQEFVRVPGLASPALVASGVIDLNRPPVAAVGEPITTGPWGLGVYGWKRIEGNYTQSLRFRGAGTNEVCGQPLIRDLGNGYSGIDASQLPPGTYEYELVYSDPADLRPVAHTYGTLTILAAVGAPPIDGIGFVANPDATATLSWPVPAAGTTALLRIRAVGAVDWVDVPASYVTIEGGRQQVKTPGDMGVGDYELHLQLMANGHTIGSAKGLMTVHPGTPTPATIQMTTPPYTPAWTETLANLPPVADIQFEAPISGAWAITWPTPASGTTAKFEWRTQGTTSWIDATTRVTTAGGRQRLDVGATELPPDTYEVRLTLVKNGRPTHFSTGRATTYTDRDLPATLANTTPPYTPAENYPPITVSFTGNADGSWSLQWAKPPAGKVTNVRVREAGTTTWIPYTAFTESGSNQRADLSPTAVPQGNWEVDVYYTSTSTGLRTDQGLRVVTVGQPPSYAAAELVDTTPPYSPGYTTPAVPGMSWVPNAGGGSTLSWTTPPAGQHAVLRYKWHYNSTWTTATFETSGTTQRKVILPGDFPNGEYDIDVTIVETATGKTKAYSSGLLTASNGTHSMADTTPPYVAPTNYPPINTTFATNAADGSWSLQWAKPASGTTTELKYRKVGTSTWLSFTSRIVTSTSTQKASFVAADLAPGSYELDLYQVTGGARTAQAKGTLSVSSTAATRPTSTVTTPTYKPAVNLPVIAAEFFPNADGSWRLQWPTPATGTTTQIRYQAPGSAVWEDLGSLVGVSGSKQFIEIPDTLATGVWKLDLAYMQNGVRVAQAMGDLTTPEDGVAATLVGTTPTEWPTIYHEAINIPEIAMEFTSYPDGSYRYRWPHPTDGGVSRAAYRTKGATEWTSADAWITTAGGYDEIFVPNAGVPAVIEIDLYYERNGVRVAQATADLTQLAPTPVAPTIVETPEPYTPPEYLVMQVPTPIDQVFYTLTATQPIAGLTGLQLIPSADGGSTLQWNKLPNVGATASFRFRVYGTATWQTLPVADAGGLQQVLIPLAPAGQYEVELTVTSGATTLGSLVGLLAVPGSDPVSHIGYTSPNPNTPSVNLQARVEREYDRWGNLTLVSDPRNKAWVTTFKYNAANQMVEQTQPGAMGSLAPADVAITRIHYDLLGRQIAVTDARGFTNEQYWDGAGRLVKEMHADDGKVTHGYNVFGDRTSTVTELDAARSALTLYGYDKLSRLVSSTHDAVNVHHVTTAWNLVYDGWMALTETTAWDSAGRKLSHTNAAGNVVSYKYDLRGNVIEARQAGITTSYAYDTLGRKIHERDGNGNYTTWTYDYFGVLRGHRDLGGSVYAYRYNDARQLIAESKDLDGTVLKNRGYEYDAAGQLVRLSDHMLGQVTTYVYDLAGMKVRERMEQGGFVYQDNHMAYDALGRLRWVGDGRAYVTMEYDLVGNRRRIQTQVINGSAPAATKADRWFAYDAMNRQVLADVDAQGRLDGGGHRIAYDRAGNKISDSWVGNVVQTIQGGTVTMIGYHGMDQTYTYTVQLPNTYKVQTGTTTEVYERDLQGRITGIERDGVEVDQRYYDRAGRVVQSGAPGLPDGYLQALNGTNSKGAVLDGTGTEVQKSQYDGNGQLAAMTAFKPDGGVKYHLWYNRVSDNQLNVDGAGNVKGYILDNRESGSKYEYTYEYELGEGYKEKKVTGVHVGRGLDGETVSTYDGNGFRTHIDDKKQDANDRWIINDASGKVLLINQSSHIQRQLIVNGEVLGRYGEVVNDDEPRDNNGVPVFKTVADFEFGFKSQAGDTPIVQDRTHVVSAGDTMQSIAQLHYGDSRLWYRVAEANGLSSNDDLKAGQVLKVPGTEVSGNASNTFRPYDPAEVIGSTTPYIPLPPPPKNGCGGVGQIIMVVVAVVAAAFTAGAALGALGTAMSAGGTALTGAAATSAVAAGTATWTAGSLVAAGAIGGAVGSIASQVVGIAIGAQDKFSWKGVALGAVGGGVTAGIGGIPGHGGGIDFTGGGAASLGNRVIQAAVSNTVTQGIGVATGLQSKFDWRGVAASAAAAGVSNAVGARVGDGFGGRMLTNLLSSTASAVVRGGSVSMRQIAVDAFGNALGGSIADVGDPTRDMFSPKYQNEMDRMSDAYNPAHQHDYRNEMDRASDAAYETRRSQEWIAQNDVITSRRAAESFARGVNGMDLDPGYKFKGDPYSPEAAALGQALLDRDLAISNENARRAELAQVKALQRAYAARVAADIEARRRHINRNDGDLAAISDQFAKWTQDQQTHMNSGQSAKPADIARLSKYNELRQPNSLRTKKWQATEFRVDVKAGTTWTLWDIDKSPTTDATVYEAENVFVGQRLHADTAGVMKYEFGQSGVETKLLASGRLEREYLQLNQAGSLGRAQVTVGSGGSATAEGGLTARYGGPMGATFDIGGNAGADFGLIRGQIRGETDFKIGPVTLTPSLTADGYLLGAGVYAGFGLKTHDTKPGGTVDFGVGFGALAGGKAKASFSVTWENWWK